MLIEASKIVGLAVGDLRSQAKIGRVSQILVEPKNLTVLAFVVDTGNLILRKIFLASFRDIVEIDKNGAVVKSQQDLLHPKELVRESELLLAKFDLKGMPVKCERSKKFLGKVTDYLIETTLGSVQKLYLQKTFKESVLPVSQIIKVTPKLILVKDENGKIKASTEMPVVAEPAS